MHDVKDYGVVCDLEVNPDVVGLAATHQVNACSHSSSKVVTADVTPAHWCQQSCGGMCFTLIACISATKPGC